jgi:hypothetical protein
VRHWLVVAVPQWRQARSANRFFERCGFLDAMWSDEVKRADEDDNGGKEEARSPADGSEGEVGEGARWLLW